jgi:uncharacterized membrane protein
MPLALDAVPLQREAEFRFTSRPNCSLTARGRKRVFRMIAAVTLIIACAFALLGYWLVLPFAGLEIGVLAWAFESLGRRSADFETLTIRADEVRLARKQGDLVERHEFNREWVRLIQEPAGGGRRARLALRSHGRETELGLFLSEEGRRALGGQLQAWLRPGSQEARTRRKF